MSKLAKTTILLMLCTVLAKVLGFAREVVLGNIYGTSLYSDIYIITLTIPAVIFTSVGNSLANIFIPLYYETKEKLGHEYSIKFTNNLICLVSIIGIIISIIGFIYAEQIVKIFAIGFETEALSIATKFLKIMIFGTTFIGISSIYSAYLQANNKYYITGLVPIPYNICIIISMILSVKFNNVYILAYGSLIAMMVQVIVQLPYAYNQGYRLKIYLDIKDEYLNKVIWLVMPVFIGIAVNQINTIVDKTLASTLIDGSVSALNYANKLNGFVSSLFTMSIATVIYPMLSRLSSDDNKEKFTESVCQSINSVILLVIPISVGAIVLSKPIVGLLFERGAFDSRATEMTAIALVFYSIGMVGFGLRDILSKVFYSLKDTRTPMVNGAIAMVMNIVLNLILVRFMGHAGLAFATSISSIICIFLLFNSLKKKIGYFGQDRIIKTTIKSLISAIIMGVITYFMYNILADILGVGFIQESIILFGSIGVGVLVYGVLVIVLKVEGINVITNMVKKKISA